MNNLYSQKTINANDLFDSFFLDNLTLYLYCFDSLPSVSFIDHLDGERAYAGFIEKFSELIANVHQYRKYKRKGKQYSFDRTIVIMKNNTIVEFDDTYCEILHDNAQTNFVNELTLFVDQFKERQRKQPLEINLIVQSSSGLALKAMEIKRTNLDLDLFYEDDFIETDELIRKRLNKKNDKGIVLLHGVPGSGKTSYLRFLVGRIKKKVMFLSPSVAGNLMNPDFIDLLMENPNSVLIIEDAENIIMDRKSNSSSAVSNLLNISDGLLADFLSVQIICTFNSSLTLIDSALTRKGRLIAKHEFGKLSLAKAQKLSNYFGFKTIIKRPMTIAELSKQNEQEFNATHQEIIGFRTTVIEN